LLYSGKEALICSRSTSFIRLTVPTRCWSS